MDGFQGKILLRPSVMANKAVNVNAASENFMVLSSSRVMIGPQAGGGIESNAGHPVQAEAWIGLLLAYAFIPSWSLPAPASRVLTALVAVINHHLFLKQGGSMSDADVSKVKLSGPPAIRVAN